MSRHIIIYGMSRHILGVFVLLGQITNTRADYNLVPVGSCPNNQLMVAVSYRSQGSWQENDSGEFEKYYNVRCDTCADGKFKAAENYQYRYEFDWNRPPNFPSCAKCASNQYKASGQTSCQSCPENTESVPGSTSLASCVSTGCPAGSYGSDSQTCTLCISGKYKATTDRSLCTNCPENSHSDVGSTALSDCICNAGSTGPNGGSCALCATGKYKESAEDDPAGSTCTPCTAGTYSSSSGSSTCTLCITGTYSSSSGRAECDKCGSGKYSTVEGAVSSSTCIKCASGKYQIMAGATSELACKMCPVGKSKR